MVELLHEYGISPDTMLIVGVGICPESRIVREAWPGTRFLGIDPHERARLFGGLLVRFAALDRSGPVRFNLRKHYWQASSIYAWGTGQQHAVQSIRPDELAPLCGRSVLLWLDCEGAELRALGGSQRILERSCAVHVEVSPHPFRGWCNQQQIDTHLAVRDFVLMKIHGDSGQMHNRTYLARRLID